MAKHTKGPWRWQADKWHGGYSGLYAADDSPVVVPQHENDGDHGAAWFASVEDAGEEGLSDGDRALIAAAPELLALAEWVAMGEHHRTCQSIVNPTGPDAALCCDCQVEAARRVIAKAKGETCDT